jgi:hypothetical protein
LKKAFSVLATQTAFIQFFSCCLNAILAILVKKDRLDILNVLSDLVGDEDVT